MTQKIHEHLANLLVGFRRLFGHEPSDQSESGVVDDPDWSFKSTDELTIPLAIRDANGRLEIKAAQGERAHEIIVATAALLGVSTPATLEWIVRRMLASSDPTMHYLAGGLKGMLEPDNGGRRVGARFVQIACLIHAEILTMRAGEISEHDIRLYAAEIVRARLKATNPGRRVASRKRLLEIYRDNEARVLEIWPEIKAFGLAE